ncbi:MAG: hypothetical protein LBT04_06550 [Prevotellaceae bacterium]|jgi:phage protein D|nr:hypothetical protein [Prevotellaceae bacterium]
MTPLFDIQLKNTSLFESIQPFLISLTITDEPGLKSDKLDLVMSDQGLELPKNWGTPQSFFRVQGNWAF